MAFKRTLKLVVCILAVMAVAVYFFGLITGGWIGYSISGADYTKGLFNSDKFAYGGDGSPSWLTFCQIFSILALIVEIVTSILNVIMHMRDWDSKFAKHWTHRVPEFTLQIIQVISNAICCLLIFIVIIVYIASVEHGGVKYSWVMCMLACFLYFVVTVCYALFTFACKQEPVGADTPRPLYV